VRLFDRYLAIDWSAANTPKTGRDSIWIAERWATGAAPSVNPPTRAAAMAILTERSLAARSRGERILVGCDFAFGYPAGAAQAITGGPGWQALWAYLAVVIADADDNASNRFTVAEALNLRLAAPHFWGHPHHHSYAHLGPRRPAYATLPEHRRAEALAQGAQPVWKLTGAGAVGSQSLLGIARLERLRHHPELGPDIAVWPFETAFADRFERPITIAEIYPSLFPLDDPTVVPKDRAQVETVVRRFAELDASGTLRDWLAPPASLSFADRAIAIAEEGWIVGVGHMEKARLGRAA
jgi:hypothetical protein